MTDSNIKYTSQAIDNLSFDEKYLVQGSVPMTETADGNSLVRQKEIAKEATVQDLYNQLGYLLDRLDYGLITDNAKRLTVVPIQATAANLNVTPVQTTAANLNATVAIASSQTLATVTTVGTVTNQARIGDVQAQRVVEAQMDTAFNLGITNNISF